MQSHNLVSGAGPQLPSGAETYTCRQSQHLERHRKQPAGGHLHVHPLQQCRLECLDDGTMVLESGQCLAFVLKNGQPLALVQPVPDVLLATSMKQPERGNHMIPMLV